VAALVVGGYVVPLLVAATMLVAAASAGVAGRLTRISLLVSLPLAVSVVLVSVFTRAGSTVLFSIGPFDATLEGVDFAAATLVRLLAIALAVGLFSMTTDPRALVADLERRGAPPRLAFVALATVEAVPTLVARGRVIAEAQRARGLDTEGSLLARARGLLPMVGPAILSSLTDVEERSLALETRAFTRPGRRALLWTVPDSGRQAGARWVIVLGLVVVLAAHVLRVV
jgi:energy-coupling factor transport system permease protein